MLGTCAHVTLSATYNSAEGWFQSVLTNLAIIHFFFGSVSEWYCMQRQKNYNETYSTRNGYVKSGSLINNSHSKETLVENLSIAWYVSNMGFLLHVYVIKPNFLLLYITSIMQIVGWFVEFRPAKGLCLFHSFIPLKCTCQRNRLQAPSSSFIQYCSLPSFNFCPK